MTDPQEEGEPAPVGPAPEPAPPPTDPDPGSGFTPEEERALRKGVSIPPRVKKWAGIVAKAASIIGLLAGLWKGIAYTNELHTTIKENAETVKRLSRENRSEHRRLREHMNKIVKATQSARKRDREVITQLRIAIAAMQAAERVRHGEGSYEGVDDVTLPGATGPSDDDPLAEVHVEPEPPRSYRARREQVRKAQDDAENAVNKAAKIQVEMSSEDPLENLEEPAP